MQENLIIETAINEIYLKEFGTTEQLLKIHEVVYENDKPKVLRVDNESEDGTAIVYFPIKGEKFYLAIWLDTYPNVSVRAVGTENYNSVYLKVTSENLSFHELASFTTLESTQGWSKGDKRKTVNLEYSFSALIFEPNPEPDAFEDKLNKLFDFLDQDKEGVIKLLQNSNACIQVATVFHNGNTMLGGHFLNKEILKRIVDYNLEIDFDLFAEGKFFID